MTPRESGRTRPGLKLADLFRAVRPQDWCFSHGVACSVTAAVVMCLQGRQQQCCSGVSTGSEPNSHVVYKKIEGFTRRRIIARPEADIVSRVMFKGESPAGPLACLPRSFGCWQSPPCRCDNEAGVFCSRRWEKIMLEKIKSQNLKSEIWPFEGKAGVRAKKNAQSVPRIAIDCLEYSTQANQEGAW